MTQNTNNRQNKPNLEKCAVLLMSALEFAWSGPTQAMRARDDAVMDLSKMADDIAEKSKLNKLTVQDLPSYVHKLHQVIGTLKSV